MAAIAFDMDYHNASNLLAVFFSIGEHNSSFYFSNSQQFNLLLFTHTLRCSWIVQPFLLFMEAETNRDNGFDVP